MSTDQPTPAGLPPPQPGQPCPCGSGQLFDVCCAPRLSGTQPAASAEELLRSRFTAHVAHDWRYLHRTYGPTAGKPYVEEEATTPIPWSRLAIHAHERGAHPDVAYVDFTAYFVDERGEHAMPEKSEFVRTDGRWLFTRTLRSGPAPFRSTAPKVGRNEPCPCGSGKKFKHCCGAG
ncbi:MAG: hypothetical protein FJ399_02185 [Verrucomicrobia bacterium]|nr:hypothetical protein [Verrucomicrobiota bacterium]